MQVQAVQTKADVLVGLCGVVSCVRYPDSAEVHRVFDDVVVVVQLQRLGIHRLVEGPGVGGVFLREHLLQDGIAVFHLLAQFTALSSPRATAASTQFSPSNLLACLPAGLGGAGGSLTA